MWRNGLLSFLCFCVFTSTLPAYADSINLVVNGSFEEPFLPASSQCGPFSNCMGFHNGVAGNDNIGGWQLIGKTGIDTNGDPIPGAPASSLLLGFNYVEPDGVSGTTLYFHPQHGVQSVDLTGEGNQGTANGIKQRVSTQPGSDYLLSFWLGHQFPSAPGYTEGPAALAVYIDGEIIGTFVNSSIATEDVAWTPFSYRFRASGPQTVIAFLNGTPVGNNYVGLDNVSISEAPEPTSLLLVGTGIMCVIFRLRRRRLFS
jgi:hypothetical protein